jgi:hypothetical protein
MNIVLIDPDLWGTAKWNFYDKIGGTHKEFLEYLSIRSDEIHPTYCDGIKMFRAPEHVLKKIENLASPHFQALYLAWRARNANTET